MHTYIYSPMTLYYARTTLNCIILWRKIFKHLKREEGNNENSPIMTNFKAFCISSWYISSLSKRVKQTWESDIRLQEKCIDKLNQCLHINFSFNFQFRGSQFWSIYFQWNWNWQARKFVVFQQQTNKKSTKDFMKLGTNIPVSKSTFLYYWKSLS